MYRCSLLSLLTVFKENPKVHTETVHTLTESCADWDFTVIKNNTHSQMNYFLCSCTCHSSYFTVLLYMRIIHKNLVVVGVRAAVAVAVVLPIGYMIMV